MIGLLIITHETIGEAYRGLADHFFPNGFPENLHILGVQPDEDQNDIINNAIAALQEFPNNRGVLIMTDIFGATPCNAARRLVRENKSAILTGLNAPMMIKAIQYSSQAENLSDFTETVK
ncbi:PTS sugar transporter subunit IIA, partial [Neisseria sp. P0015.S010]